MSEGVAQEYRIALMGLGGRAVLLAESGELSDAEPYLDAARAVYGDSECLAGDISAALAMERSDAHSQWQDWEVPEHIGSWSGMVSADRYPLTCFAVLLMERTYDASLALNLRGDARHTLDWFNANSERLERFVVETPSASAEQRRQFSTEVLEKAARRDEVEEDLEIIGRPLSTEKLNNLRSGVQAGWIRSGVVERLFDEAKAVLRVDGDGVLVPNERSIQDWFGKGHFVDAKDYDRIGYSAVGGELWGRGLSRDAVRLLWEALAGAPRMLAPLDSAESLFQAIESAASDLGVDSNLAVVLGGSMAGLLHHARVGLVEGYEPLRRSPDSDPSVELARYHGYPILRGPESGKPGACVVDVGTWGNYVRAPFDDGEELRVDVEVISQEQAREILDGNPDYGADQLDDESRVRKIQTMVLVKVGVRHGFRVVDPTRARTIVSE